MANEKNVTNINVYLPNELGKKLRAATEAGLIERGFVSRAVQEAVQARIDEIEAQASAYERYRANNAE